MPPIIEYLYIALVKIIPNRAPPSLDIKIYKDLIVFGLPCIEEILQTMKYKMLGDSDSEPFRTSLAQWVIKYFSNKSSLERNTYYVLCIFVVCVVFFVILRICVEKMCTLSYFSMVVLLKLQNHGALDRLLKSARV